MITQLDWKPTTICGVPIWTSITEDEGRRLQELAAGRLVLEVGSLFGYSTVCMASVAERVVSVDAHDVKATDSAPDSMNILYGNLVDAGVADKVSIRVGWSRDVLPVLREHSMFDGVFIDGDHSEEGCWFDLTRCWSMLRPGGFLAVHDYAYGPLPGVRAAVDAFVASTSGVVGEGVTDTMWTGRRAA